MLCRVDIRFVLPEERYISWLTNRVHFRMLYFKSLTVDIVKKKCQSINFARLWHFTTMPDYAINDKLFVSLCLFNDTLNGSRVYNVGRSSELWTVQCVWGRSFCGLVRGRFTVPEFSCRDWRKTWKVLLRIVGVAAEICYRICKMCVCVCKLCSHHILFWWLVPAVCVYVNCVHTRSCVSHFLYFSL